MHELLVLSYNADFAPDSVVVSGEGFASPAMSAAARH